MCGVFGRFNFRTQQPVQRAELEAMAKLLGHRGPDGEGFFEHGHLALGHKRLAIIDLEGGRQPMRSGDLTISYNGEVFNYLELLRELSQRGVPAKSQSDTEAILLSYAEYGLDFVQRLNGMFAFALWDEAKQRLLLVRDRMGVKPLYYAFTKDGVVFASELKALRVAAGVDGSLDLEAFDDYMTLGYVVHPRSIARGIRKLDPGTMLILEEGKEPKFSTYWRLAFHPDYSKSEDQWAEELKSVFEDAVRLRLRSDVPLGVLLSGGVDSTAIATTQARLSPNSGGLNSYTVGVDVPGAINEFQWAREVANSLGTTHHELRLTSEENGAHLVEAASMLDEPLVEPMVGQLLAVCRLARKKVTVLLSGEGADETWLGYSAYRRMYLLEKLRQLLPSSVVRNARPLLEFVASHVTIPASKLKQLRNALEPLERGYLGLNNFDPLQRLKLYSSSTRNVLLHRDVRESMRLLYDDAGGPETMSRMAAVDCRGWLVDNTLARSDVISMAASLELRVPFMDYRLVELAMRVPASFKVRGGSHKWILKRALRDRVPSTIANRKKMGFPTPLASLLRGRWGRQAEAELMDPSRTSKELFERDRIRRMFRDHRAGRNDFSMPIIQLLMFEYWAARADELSALRST
jgi:asparagine synthase (glutamine-hydrolysing)